MELRLKYNEEYTYIYKSVSEKSLPNDGGIFDLNNKF